MNKGKFFLGIVLIWLSFGRMQKCWARNELLFQDYALPDNSMRAKLDSIFQQHIVKTCTHDKSWVDFGSWHWTIGELVADDATSFVIKMAKYPANVPIITPQYPQLMQIHTPQQNISRICRSLHANTIITDHHLSRLKVPACWLYPLSGNDNDLGIRDITDHQVVIVEEMIKKKSNQMAWCSHVNANVQADVLQLDAAAFSQLAVLAQQGKFVDLTPKNLLVDEKDNVVLIDLEDTLSQRKKEIEKAHFLVRPLKRFKLQCEQEASALHSIGITGLSNTLYPDVKRHGKQLIQKSKCTFFIKRNAFEIVAVAIVVVTTFVLIMRHMYYTRKINTCIKHYNAAIERILKTGGIQANASQEVYKEVAKKVISDFMPHKNCEKIINAFATIAIASNMRYEHHVGKINILTKEYDSPAKAIKKSMRLIHAVWGSDASWCSNVIAHIKHISEENCLTATW